MIEIRPCINGTNVTIQVEPGETLLEMLRNRMDLTGTKRGCEVGECGACTVLVDGIPTDSCLFLAAMSDGKEITTIEGIEQNRELAAIQQAFIDEGAIQCGFCTPGLIMTSYALLKNHIKLSTEDIKRGLAGNMCRCAAYKQIIAAVKSVQKN